MTHDDFHRARLAATNEWTPAHGTQKRIYRRAARARLKAWTRRILGALHIGTDDEERGR